MTWSVPGSPDVRPADWTLHSNLSGGGPNAGPTVSIFVLKGSMDRIWCVKKETSDRYRKTTKPQYLYYRKEHNLQNGPNRWSTDFGKTIESYNRFLNKTTPPTNLAGRENDLKYYGMTRNNMPTWTSQSYDDSGSFHTLGRWNALRLQVYPAGTPLPLPATSRAVEVWYFHGSSPYGGEEWRDTPRSVDATRLWQWLQAPARLEQRRLVDAVMRYKCPTCPVPAGQVPLDQQTNFKAANYFPERPGSQAVDTRNCKDCLLLQRQPSAKVITNRWKQVLNKSRQKALPGSA